MNSRILNDNMTEDPDKQVAKIELQITRLIIPFAYQEAYRTMTINPDHWTSSPNIYKDLFEHIGHLVISEAEAKENNQRDSIGMRFALKKGNERTLFGLPKNLSTPIFLEIKNQTFLFYIKDVELFLFETQVGFIVYEVAVDKLTIDELITFNYYVKKFNLGQTRFYFSKPIAKGQLESVALDLASTTYKLVEELAPQTFFSNNKRLPEEALVFSSVTLPFEGLSKENSDDQLKEYLFRLRRSFKESYKPCLEEFDSVNNPEVFHPFENIYWGASLEGLANLCYLTEDKKTNQFLLSNFQGNLKGTYFYIYMLALHQRYALLYLSILASHLSPLIEEYEEDINSKPSQNSDLFKVTNTRPRNLLEIGLLKRKMVNFTLRSAFKHVSQVTHQSHLYEMIIKTLRIEELKNELHTELEALATISELEEAKRLQRIEQEQARLREQEEVKKARFERFIIIITTLFVTISTVTDGWDLVEKIRGLNYQGGELVHLLMILGLFAGIGVGVILVPKLIHHK